MVSGVSTADDQSSSCSRAMDPDKLLRCSWNHGHQHDFQPQHKPWASTWHSEDMDINQDTASINHGPRHGPLHQHRPKDHHGFGWAAQATQINVAPGGSTADKHQHGSQLQHRLWTSTWPLVVAWDIDINIVLLGTVGPQTQT